MSFWFCQNAILSTECRRKAFLTNNVLERILLVCQTLEVIKWIEQIHHSCLKNKQKHLTCIFFSEKKEEKYIICKRCRQKIAKFDSLFPMSKEGVKTNFCNSSMFFIAFKFFVEFDYLAFELSIPGGYIHDTHTITSALSDAVSISGDLTSEFCWFPGYM